ncbi:uncharacterized protein LOC115567202 isoform X5 [Sparus aurata]|uniref:uncharacterized protein LOC115567202 isoform X5 n=1 Tax=Sparus aurata TaxID=8175 RepID=UPI0011C13276|nr:uncharacterized protein LOC115567202 isoform X5 [Sparus aurata]
MSVTIPVAERSKKDINTPTEALRQKNYRVCSAHFDKDDFVLSKSPAGPENPLKTYLKKNAVPRVEQVATDSTEVTAGSSSKILPAVRHVACQTDLPLSAGTQVYMKTYLRSKGTQARVASRDCGMCTLTFPLDSPLLFLQPTIIKRPSKRPRLSLTDKEEGPSQCKLSLLVHEPENST